MIRTELYSDIQSYIERPVISQITSPIGKIKPTIVTLYDLSFDVTNKEQLEFYGIVSVGNSGLRSVEIGILQPLSIYIDFITLKVGLDKTIIAKVRNTESADITVNNGTIMYNLIEGKYKVVFLATDNLNNKSYSSVKLFEYRRY